MPRHLQGPPLLVFLALFTLGACKAETPVVAAPPAAAAATAPPSTPARIAAPNPLSNPHDELKASMRKFINLTSYQASMEVKMDAAPNGVMRNQLEFVAPDRYRMTMQGVGTQVIIGNTMHMDIAGRQMKVPLPAGTLSQWRDPGKLDENATGMTVKALGSTTLDGKPARKYLIHHSKPQPSDVTMWIGRDDLPMQIHVVANADGRASEMTMRYSRFNDAAIVIDPPK